MNGAVVPVNLPVTDCPVARWMRTGSKSVRGREHSILSMNFRVIGSATVALWRIGAQQSSGYNAYLIISPVGSIQLIISCDENISGCRLLLSYRVFLTGPRLRSGRVVIS
ncbi:hypothetical protein J6590_034623 [Homalodisca vitripennis]|nr:hypothetical protein J6590_034623 [Homalodisca vitripennis]